MEVTNYKEVDINIEGKVMEITATGKFEKADYEMFVPAAEEMLKEHEQSVEMVEAGLEFHEKNLAESLQSGAESDVDDALVERHTEEAGKFAKQREAHERIKKHHHVAMAHVASLKRELEATAQF